jgi:hypothetical protein
MLEKTLGVTLVTKLQAILLMEGDFNAVNKIVYGTRMLDYAWKHRLMPEEILAKKQDGQQRDAIQNVILQHYQASKSPGGNCICQRLQLLQ